MSAREQILDLGRRWAKAEESGDTAALGEMTTEDFTLVGPAGFVLKKDAWLERYTTGGLVTHSLVWDEVEVRDYGTAAVSVGRHTQKAEYQGRPVDGTFRVTHVAVQRDGRWLLAGAHLSPIVARP